VKECKHPAAGVPNEGYVAPDENAVQSGSATPAQLGRARAARRAAQLARLGSMADRMPTVFSLRVGRRMMSISKSVLKARMV